MHSSIFAMFKGDSTQVKASSSYMDGDFDLHEVLRDRNPLEIVDHEEDSPLRSVLGDISHGANFYEGFDERYQEEVEKASKDSSSKIDKKFAHDLDDLTCRAILVHPTTKVFDKEALKRSMAGKFKVKLEGSGNVRPSKKPRHLVKKSEVTILEINLPDPKRTMTSDLPLLKRRLRRSKKLVTKRYSEIEAEVIARDKATEELKKGVAKSLLDGFENFRDQIEEKLSDLDLNSFDSSLSKDETRKDKGTTEGRGKTASRDD
ncbi:unnamed protein product [Ilex paraguariensis]|uniref:Uncharacterized protein n=1 Tax=Ilex paraguariensis TaxID=185542 RepID=A0ABC8TAS7_9AQUA